MWVQDFFILLQFTRWGIFPKKFSECPSSETTGPIKKIGVQQLDLGVTSVSTFDPN